ncbi:MAG: PaaI family thioesterase [candidate division WOR-3 bacterium]
MRYKKLPYFDGCVVCGKKNPVGLKLDFYLNEEKNFVFAEVVFDKNYIGYDNIIHGGIVTMVLDETMAWANIELTGKMALTKSIRVNFLKPVKSGLKYKVESHLKEKLDNKTITIAVLKDADESVCAESEGEFILMSETRSEKMKKGLTY